MEPSRRRAQTGAITILVSLMLLVLLTLAALGMSKNSFREVLISGTSREGAMSSNVAESGLEWGIYWLAPTNSSSASGAAADLVALKTALLADSSLDGVPYDVLSSSATSPTAYVPGANTVATLATISTLTGTTQTYSVGLTNMGKLPLTDTSQGTSSGSYAPATGSTTTSAPDLWAVRSDAQVKTGSVVFSHGKEAWVSTPIQ